MKIKRFNEELEGTYNYSDKILKVTFSGSFEVPLEKIENSEYFQRWNDLKKPEDKMSIIYTALERYIYDNQSGYYDFELYDGFGNLIEDEQEFDRSIEATKKYNV